MIPDAVQVFVAIGPVDLRSGFDRLAGFARERIGRESSASALFVFFGRRRDAVKIVFLDLCPRDWARTRSRLVASELEREVARSWFRRPKSNRERALGDSGTREGCQRRALSGTTPVHAAATVQQ